MIQKFTLIMSSIQRTMKNLTLLTVMLGLGYGQVMAETTIGETGNGWNSAGSYTTAYTLGKNQTLKLNFKVNDTRGTYIADGWVTILSKKESPTEYSSQYLFMRTDCYGVSEWDWTNKTTGGSGWFTYNGNNFVWPENNPETNEDEATTGFQTYIKGSTVDLTIMRLGKEVIMTTDVMTTSLTKYRHYFVMDCGDGEQDIYAFLAADYANITINSESTTATIEPEITGTLIGSLNDALGIKVSGTTYQDFNLAPNSTLKLKFKNYSARVANWMSWLFELEYNGKFCNVVAGNNNTWGDLNVAGSFSNNNWPTELDILDKLEGATVDLTVTRSNANVSISAIHTPVSGAPFTLNYSFTPTEDGFATGNAIIRVLSDHSHIDLLPVSMDISAAGWATYCSPYALNLAGASSELTDAYIVTGGSNGVLTKTSVKNGTVPANTGLLLKGQGTVNIPIVGSSSTDVSDNILQGVTTATGIDAEAGWVLMGSPSLGFYQNINEFTVGANTAYIPVTRLSVPATARTFYFFDDEATGVSTAKAEQTTCEVYNLQGQRIASPKSGLYIVNGKKVIMK